MELLAPGFWVAMLWIAFIMWIIKMVWKINKNVQSIERKLDSILADKNQQ